MTGVHSPEDCVDDGGIVADNELASLVGLGLGINDEELDELELLVDDSLLESLELEDELSLLEDDVSLELLTLLDSVELVTLELSSTFDVDVAFEDSNELLDEIAGLQPANAPRAKTPANKLAKIFLFFFIYFLLN